MTYNKTYTTNDLERQYNEMLDEVHGEAKIAGYEYQTSRALKQIDPTAYRCGFADWLDAECGEGRFFELPTGDYTDIDPSEGVAS
jgi:hypothetical protein